MERLINDNKMTEDITLNPTDGNLESLAEKTAYAAIAAKINSGRSPDRIRRNQMLAVLFRIEEYLQDNDVEPGNLYSIEYFVKEFLNILALNKSQFARFIDLDVSNLNKYYKGQRAFSTELAMKFSHFFHTPVDVWLKIQLKNDLLALQQENTEKYLKYDYEKLLTA